MSLPLVATLLPCLWMTLSAIVIRPVAVVAIVAISFLIKEYIWGIEIHTGRKTTQRFF